LGMWWGRRPAHPVRSVQLGRRSVRLVQARIPAPTPARRSCRHAL